MPSIPLHPPPASTTARAQPSNPLPQLLQTPSGLAILEIQGTLNNPSSQEALDTAADDNRSNPTVNGQAGTTSPAASEIGRIVFPDWSESLAKDDKKWMKRVYLYVGKHQRMTGEVRELKTPVAVIRRRGQEGLTDVDAGDVDAGDVTNGGEEREELEIVEIVRHKILFAHRPEPVGTEEMVV